MAIAYADGEAEVVKDRYDSLSQKLFVFTRPEVPQRRTVDYALAVNLLAASLLAPRPEGLTLNSDMAIKLAEVTIDAAESLAA